MSLFQEVFSQLYSHYGPQGWWPLIDRSSEPMKCRYVRENSVKAKSPEEVFEICIGAILTQNTSWSNAEKALISLIKADFLDPLRLSRAENDHIAELIMSSGYYNQKAKKLKAFASFFLKEPAPDRELFLSQWGLGPETADDMLLYAYDQPVFVVDLYTKRLFSRLGACAEKVSYHELQDLISGGIEKDVTLYKEYHALIVRHAKDFCRKTPDCSNCSVLKCCPQRSAIEQSRSVHSCS